MASVCTKWQQTQRNPSYRGYQRSRVLPPACGPPFHPHLAASAAELARARRRPAGCRRWGRATTTAAARARRQLPLLNMLLLLDVAATGWGCTSIRAAVLVGRKGAANGGHHADHH